jgi:hypothetical protein
VVPNAAPLNCDTNSDGYGNICDADINNSNTTNLADFNAWRASFAAGGSNLAADHNCSGTVNLADFNLWRLNFQTPARFSSGLSCAGTVPCN